MLPCAMPKHPKFCHDPDTQNVNAIVWLTGEGIRVYINKQVKSRVCRNFRLKKESGHAFTCSHLLSWHQGAVRVAVRWSCAGLCFRGRHDLGSRDGAGESGDPDEKLYWSMSFWPIIEFIWDEPEEANLVEMINDPLLTRMLRARAMGQLKKRFDWPATNTVPEP